MKVPRKIPEIIENTSSDIPKPPPMPQNLSELQKAWDNVYHQHKTGLYMDRHHLWRLFPEFSPLPPHTKKDIFERNEANYFLCPCGEDLKIGQEIYDSQQHCYKCPYCGFHLLYRSSFIFTENKNGQCKGKEVPFCPIDTSSKPLNFLDLGCGVGNLSFALLEKNDKIVPYCIDFSAEAVRLARLRPRYDTARLSFNQGDITAPLLVDRVFDQASLIFVLDAIPSEKIHQIFSNVSAVMSANGTLFVLDHAAGDSKEAKHLAAEEGMIRGKEGTISHFYSVEWLSAEAEKGGFKCVDSGYIENLVRNRKSGEEMIRRYCWLKLRKSIKIN